MARKKSELSRAPLMAIAETACDAGGGADAVLIYRKNDGSIVAMSTPDVSADEAILLCELGKLEMWAGHRVFGDDKDGDE